MNTTKTLIAGAAVAGLMAGSLPVRAYAANTSTQAGVSLQTMADEKGTHSCKGQNACKGQGGCKTSDASCEAKTPVKAKAVAPRTAPSPSNLTGNSTGSPVFRLRAPPTLLTASGKIGARHVGFAATETLEREIAPLL